MKILFYPDCPSIHTTIYGILKYLKIEMTSDPNEYWDMAICWEDTTYRNIYVISKLLKDNPNKLIINQSCNDISKEKIDKVFKNIFGYSSFVNPIHHNGICVEKSNLNAKHNGRIIYCPISSPKYETIYQRLIDNQNEKWGIYDIRTHIINKQIPFVYIKQKTNSHRFEDEFFISSIEETNNIFSYEEIDLIIHFCQEFGLQYGELDILRDYNDRRIYIIDVNNTPWFSTSLQDGDTEIAIYRLSQAFKNEFCNLI